MIWEWYVLLGQFRSQTVIPVHRAKDLGVQKTSSHIIVSTKIKSVSLQENNWSGDWQTSPCRILHFHSRNLIDKTVPCECNCKYIDENSYPLQVTDEYSFTVEELIKRTLQLFQEGHTSQGKRHSWPPFCLLSVTENELCLYLFHTFIAALRAQQEANL